MKNKIIMFVLFIGLLINPVMCETFQDNFIHSGSESIDYSIGGGSDSIAGPYYVDSLYINDIGTLQNINLITVQYPGSAVYSLTKDSAYNGVTFLIGGVNKGHGIYGYSYNPDRSKIFIHLWVQELDTTGLSGAKTLVFSGNDIDIRGKDGNAARTALWNPPQGNVKNAFFSYNSGSWFLRSDYGTGYYNIDTYYYFDFPFNYSNDDNIYRIEMDRSISLSSKVKIEILNTFPYNESDYETYNLDYINISSDTWKVYNEDVFGNIQTKDLIFGVPSYEPTLTTDKTYYNASELIEISYTNIDVIYDECISSLCNEPYQLWIYALNTPNIPKFRQWLYSDRRDETFTLNTSVLTPQTEYQLMITSGENNIVISSNIFYVYPDDEYLSISCDANANCITANKAKNTFYYKINNNSNIIVKDNDNNIISTYYNIIGTGSIIYTIPDDLEHINTYPNWKVYLNNTEYSTSFNKEMVVYWSLFVTPTPTPTYTPQPTPDINISDTIDEFKTETQPIKDLIFGLSEIVIDNPDYNKDNIVDESEINHWFNSLIPLCIIFLLIVLYIGLKKNRND